MTPELADFDGARLSRLVLGGPAHLETTDARLVTAPVRSLPDFVVVGAQKSGTTSFFEYMTSLPEVDAGLRKEAHFFDQLMYHRQPEWNDKLYYRSMFPPFWSGTTGEASPYYMFQPLAAERLAAMVPEAVLVALLRDPVDRAYSHYHHERRESREDLAFEEAVAAEPTRLEGEEKRLASDPTAASFEFRHHSYLSRGRYARQLSRLFHHFPRRRVIIVDSHRFFDAPRKVLAGVLGAMGVHPARARDADVGHIARKGEYPEMDPETRRCLQSWFAPHDRELRRLLGRRFSWM